MPKFNRKNKVYTFKTKLLWEGRIDAPPHRVLTTKKDSLRKLSNLQSLRSTAQKLCQSKILFNHLRKTKRLNKNGEWGALTTVSSKTNQLVIHKKNLQIEDQLNLELCQITVHKTRCHQKLFKLCKSLLWRRTSLLWYVNRAPQSTQDLWSQTICQTHPSQRQLISSQLWPALSRWKAVSNRLSTWPDSSFWK